MLKKIPSILPPELLKILFEMGHGDKIVIADGNFPSSSHGKRIIRCDGSGAKEILDAVLTLLPLDKYVEKPVSLMAVGKEFPGEPEIWEKYKEIIINHEDNSTADFNKIERFSFYEEAKKAYAIIATGEKALYANVILQKGVI